ncbi:unnamed protein product [Haemonchus placei]|uniref:DUF3060 domain-containing protein n=1 Tax=Haemonchus placei TaxID=6290 RepID=A0A0N4WQ57_HAEPC|nr:unnamed protein product [Haemonchus placei]
MVLSSNDQIDFLAEGSTFDAVSIDGQVMERNREELRLKVTGEIHRMTACDGDAGNPTYADMPVQLEFTGQGPR